MYNIYVLEPMNKQNESLSIRETWKRDNSAQEITLKRPKSLILGGF